MVQKVFRDIALQMSPKQPQMVDQITEEAPILDMLPMQEASHGLFNVYEEIKSIDGGGLVDMDDQLPEVDASMELKQIDLSILGGVMYVGEDKAKRYAGGGDAGVGAQRYFASKMPWILRETGMAAERSILYNSLRAKAIASGGASGQLIDSGGTGAINYSILAVKWVPGETTGLYDPAGFGRKTLMDIKALNGGALFERAVTRADTTVRSVLSYGMRMKSYFGIQLANARYVAAIVNIDLTYANGLYTSLPSEKMIDDILDAVRANPGNTFLYMHNKVLTALQDYKAASLMVDINVSDMDRRFRAWNGIPMVPSYQFLKALEPKVTV